MIFILIVLLFTGIAILLRHHEGAICILAFILWCLIPGIVVPLFTHGSSGIRSIHPAALLIMASTIVQVVVHYKYVHMAFNRRAEWILIPLCAATVGALLGKVLQEGSDWIAAVVNEFLAPVFFFLMIGSAICRNPLVARRLVITILAVGALESLLAFAQRQVGAPLIYTSIYSHQRWYSPYFDRWMGTLDHPLVLALLVAMSVALLGVIKNSIIIAVLLIVDGSGLVAAESRASIIAAIVGLAYLLVAGRSRRRSRIAIAVTTLVAGVTVFEAGFFDSLVARAENDTGSTQARYQALLFFLDRLHEYVWLGTGPGSSYALSNASGLNSSFESAFLMYTVDFGLVTTLAYFAVMVSIIVRGMRHGNRPAALAAAVGVAVVQTFSALSGVGTPVPAILWTFLAMAAFTPRPHSQHASPVGSSATDFSTTRRTTSAARAIAPSISRMPS